MKLTIGTPVRVGLAYRMGIGPVPDAFTGLVGVVEAIDRSDVRIETTRGALIWLNERRLEVLP